MKKYKVLLKNKQTVIREGYGFTVRDGKYYFHKKEDKSDFDSFVLEKDTVSIDEWPPFEGATPTSIDLG